MMAMRSPACRPCAAKALAVRATMLRVLRPRPLAIDAERLGAERDRVGLRAAPARTSSAGAVVRRRSSAERSVCGGVTHHTTVAIARARCQSLRPGHRRPAWRSPAAMCCHVPALVGGAPVDDGIAHAEHGQHGEARIRITRDAAVGDAGQDHVLEAALDAPRLAPEAAAAAGRQIAPLVDEHLDVVAPVFDRCQMRGDQPRELVERLAVAFDHRLGPFDEAVGAADAHDLQRRLLGGEVVVEAGLAHAEHVGDGLGGGAVVAALGEHARGRVDDLLGAAQHPAVADEARARRMRIHL